MLLLINSYPNRNQTMSGLKDTITKSEMNIHYFILQDHTYIWLPCSKISTQHSEFQFIGPYIWYCHSMLVVCHVTFNLFLFISQLPCIHTQLSLQGAVQYWGTDYQKCKTTSCELHRNKWLVQFLHIYLSAAGHHM